MIQLFSYIIGKETTHPELQCLRVFLIFSPACRDAPKMMVEEGEYWEILVDAP